jgi:hypothetical protein
MLCQRCKKECPDDQLRSLNRGALSALGHALTLEGGVGHVGSLSGESEKNFCPKCVRVLNIYVCFLVVIVAGGFLVSVLKWLFS